jgi:DNA-binding NtrC family response regulator
MVGSPRAKRSTAVGMPAPPTAAAPGPLKQEVDEVERRRIVEALETCAGNQTRAAAALGISRNTLAARMEQFGIARPRKR